MHIDAKSMTESYVLVDEEGDGTGADDGSVNVIDIVDAFRLKEIELGKKAWTAYIKGKA